MAVNFDSYSFFDGENMTPVTQITWADFWRGVIPDGVVGGIGDEMKPFANSTGMYVYVEPGACMVDNHRAVVSSRKQLAVSAAHATKPRIDILVARVVYGNEDESIVELAVKEGTAAVDPVPPSLTQVTGTTYEIKIAEIYVAPAVVTLTADAVTDFRKVFTCAMQSVSFLNADTIPLEKGMLVKLSNTMPESVKRCRYGEIPAGTVESEYIAVGARGQVNTHVGQVAEIKCTQGEVKVGDALIPDDANPGLAVTGGGYAGGLALNAKASGAVGNVKSLLTFFSKIPIQNEWFAVDGIIRSQILAAFQFIGRGSEQNALVNINEGQEFALSKNSNLIQWDTETGFYFPYNSGIGLTNEDLMKTEGSGLNLKIRSAAFGFRMVTDSSYTFCGGLNLSWERGLVLRGWETPDYNELAPISRPAISAAANDISSGSSQPVAGVLGGTWGDTTKIYVNGALETMQRGKVYSAYNTPEPTGFGQSVWDANIPFYMTAAVFFTAPLNASQHMQLASNIAALGGIG